MAINVNVPGVGNISVEGAASEQTLQQLVAAMTGNNTRQRRDAAEMSNDLKRASQAADDVSSSMRGTSNSAKQAQSSVAVMAERMSTSIIAVTGQYQVNTSTVGEFAHNLLQTSTQISREWTRAFVNLSHGLDPIALSASTFKAGIDAAGATAAGLSNILGPTVGGVAKVFTALGMSIGKTGIDLFKNQLEGSVKAMERYNKMGAVFSEGMGEMRLLTGKTGLTFEQLARVVESSRDNIKLFGGTVTNGVKQLADVTDEMAKIGPSGTSVRNQLLKLNIGLEEQVEMAASLMAQQRSEKMTRTSTQRDAKAVAELTAKYAIDLKVLQEATGKDAKAIMEKARTETMTAGLMRSLSQEQQTSMKQSIAGLAGLEEAAPGITGNIKRAIAQQAAYGTITDEVVANSDVLSKMVREIASGIKDGNTDMTQFTMKRAELLKKELQQRSTAGGMESDISMIGYMSDSLSGPLAKYNQGVNEILAAKNLEVGTTEKSLQNVKNVMNTTEVLTNATAKITEQSANITNSLNNISTQALPKVVPAVADLVEGAAQAAKRAEKVFTGKMSMDQFLAELKDGTVTALKDGWNTSISYLKKSLDDYFGVRRPAAAPSATPIRDTGTLGMTGQLFEIEDFYGKVAKGETVLTPKQLENLVSGVSGATMGKAISKSTLNASPGPSLDAGASDSIKQIQNLYSAAMRDITIEKARAEAQKPIEKTGTDIPQEFTDALGKFNIIPLSASIDNLARQVTTSSSDQQSLLNQQIDKLSSLVSAMQDNVRYSERIANELG